MKKMLTFTSFAVVACLSLVSPARGQQNKDIVDTAVAAGSFKTLAKGNSVMVNTARVVTTDIVASNGVIHVIDHVLLPPAE